MRSSAKYRPSEISHVSTDDRFAAMQIVMVTKRLLRPMSVLLSYFVVPFIVQFCGFEIRNHFRYFRPSTSERIRIC